MSQIQDKLNSLQPYVSGIRYFQGIQIVDASFKEGWLIMDSDSIKKEMLDGDNYYMFYAEREGVTIDNILEHVENIILFNIEREKKHDLLKLKVKELQILFQENSLAKLKKLRYTFQNDDLTPSLLDMEINLDEEMVTETKNTSTPLTTKVNEPVNEPANQPITELAPEENTKKNGNVKNINGQKIELPPRDTKIVVEEFNEPTITCKCGPDDLCPICEDEKLN